VLATALFTDIVGSTEKAAALGDRYERNHTMAALLKFLVLFVSSIKIMQRLRSYGLSLF
jgi:hypothetical protein